MKRPGVSKNPENTKGGKALVKGAYKVAEAIVRSLGGMQDFDNAAQPGEMPRQKKSVSPNSTKKTISKPTNKW